jgi:hypothetical protein
MHVYLKDSILEVIFEFFFATVPLLFAEWLGFDFDSSRSYLGFSVLFYFVLISLVVAILWISGRLRKS